MTHQLNRLDRVRAEARQAAAKWNDINAACPYPWGSEEAVEFKREFLAEQDRIATRAMEEAQALEPFCGCDHELTMQELESMRCQECGKAVVA